METRMRFVDVIKTIESTVKENNLDWEADGRRYNKHKINFYSNVTGALVAIYNSRTGTIEIVK